MNERIMIAGKAVDLSNGKCLSFEVTSNIMKKVSDMSAGYSYTYEIPNTVNNRRILGDLLNIGRAGNKSRKYLDAEYYRDDILIFRGHCYVGEVTESTIGIYFQFGLSTALQQIKDDGVTLNRLWNDDDNDFVAVAGTTGIDNISDLCVTYPCKKSDWLLFSDVRTEPIAPVIPLYNTISSDKPSVDAGRTYHAIDIKKTILAQISKRYGLTFDGLDNHSGYLQYKPSLKKYSHFTIHSTGYKITTDSVFPDYDPVSCIKTSFSKTTTSVTSDNDCEIRKDRQLVDFSWLGDDAELIIKHECEIDSVSISFSANVGGYLYYCSSDGAIYHQIGRYTADELFVETFSPKENGWSYICKAVACPSFFLDVTGTSETATCSMDITINAHFNGKEIESGLVNLFDTLPEMNALQFLTDFAFVQFGSYPINQMRGGNIIKFTDLDSVRFNTPFDWSDKLIADDLKLHHDIENTAHTNWFCWKDDDSEILYDAEHVFDRPITTEDETLDKETDYFTCGFSYAIPHYGNKSAWFVTKNEDTDKTPAPRLMMLNYTSYYTDGGTRYAQMTQADNIIRPNSDQTGKETELDEILKKPVRIECKIKLSSLDIASIDFSRPVYLRQFGAMFYIEKLSVGETATDAILVKFSN